MAINEKIFLNNEKKNFVLRELYFNKGYKPYRMSKFEEYDLYANNKSFLVSDNVITFTDTNGKLMALKPDVTLSIIKNSKDLPNETCKVFYSENIYRIAKNVGSYQEIMQTGVECFGKVDNDTICEVVSLAIESLLTVSNDVVLSLSYLDIIENVISELNISQVETEQLYKAISEKNLHGIESALIENGDKEKIEVLKSLIQLDEDVSETLIKLEKLNLNAKNKYAITDFIKVLKNLEAMDKAKFIKVDFSVIGDINYYNGIVFKGFVKGTPNAVLSGGQYDKLMAKMAHKSKAIGFAVYMDELERIGEKVPKKKEDGEFINVALPKGRLGEKVYDMFSRAGFDCPSILENNRKLIFTNEEKKIRYFWVKPSDVAIYVERGAADIGVAGKDILLEYNPDVYELLDLNMGKCRMAVASKKEFIDDGTKTIRVATKFTNIAKSYYRSKGRDIDIIHLNGSIEIAPILGLSDVIVDIVETGTTLKENNLEVKEEIVPISARLISNKSAFKFKGKEISNIVESLSKIVKE